MIKYDKVYLEHLDRFAGDAPKLSKILKACGADDETIQSVRIKTRKELKKEEKEERRAKKLEYKRAKEALKAELKSEISLSAQK